MATFQVGFSFEAFYLQLDSTSHGLSNRFSFYSLSFLHSGACMGKLTAGIVSAYAGVLNTVIGSSLISSAVIFAMIGLHSVASVVLIGISYGYFSGVCTATMAPLISLLTPEISDLGIRIGISFAISGIGALVGTCTICFLDRHSRSAQSVTICGSIMFAFMQFILKICQKTAGVYSKEAGV
ncbi:hypothetical protein AZE42_08335 [Rhizopogon vesiculosus]|uniref:Major facilitator superfamily (MFS) profile domain-containing protein n=1 Tax=Rhizopogon vesiculosus TaxID=180088 RepID=A0A1J8Q6J9_9AGAM|nr:hypothetical protein AZE42_08335 [Rhizopogon vesiculosus]